MLLPLPVWLFRAGWPNSMRLHMQAAPQCGQERGAAPAPANHPAAEQVHRLVPPAVQQMVHLLHTPSYRGVEGRRELPPGSHRGRQGREGGGRDGGVDVWLQAVAVDCGAGLQAAND
jgi:hypothetical protein